MFHAMHKHVLDSANKFPAVTIGSDMEFFCKKEGLIVISQGLIPGSKHEPVTLAEGILMHRDNCLGEFTINPSQNHKEFLANCFASYDRVQEVCDSIGVRPYFNSFHMFDVADLIHPECMQFGCEPDFSAFTGAANMSPDPWSIGTGRSAGGHIHIGYDNPTKELNCAIVQLMDLFVGSLFTCELEGGQSRSRRALYGAASCMRHKPYGVEYRTPGPEWFGYLLGNKNKSTRIVEYITAAARISVAMAKKGFVLNTIPKHKNLAAIVVKTINAYGVDEYMVDGKHHAGHLEHFFDSVGGLEAYAA